VAVLCTVVRVEAASLYKILRRGREMAGGGGEVRNYAEMVAEAAAQSVLTVWVRLAVRALTSLVINWRVWAF
jgi:hypothetical protein